MNLWHNARLLNALANTLFALALASVLAAAAWWASQRPVFTLRGLAIDAAPGSELHHVSSQLLRQAAHGNVRGNFFTIDLNRVRAAFEHVPWVRRASVRRVWPNRLQVGIEEHRPMAIWGEGQLLNTFGEPFVANVDEAEEDGRLPSFAGPPGSEAQVVRRFEDLASWVAPMQRRPVALTLSPRYAWTVRLDDDTTLLLGRDQGMPIEERVRRWVAVFPSVQARLDRKAEVIDLRYPNGFAVKSVAVLAAEGASRHGKTSR